MEKTMQVIFEQNMRQIRFIILLIIVLRPGIAGAQVFGGTPSSVKWLQLNTDAVRVIFPRGLDTVAGDIAAIAGRLNRSSAFSLGNKHRKVDIVLHNLTTASNGYVGLGPFRSEFYLTPLANGFRLGSLPWHEQLAIHEYRHVEQYNNFNVGLSKAFRLVFGEEGQAFANGMAIPDWFFEGDAVFNETRVSGQGRGRIPYFYNGFTALWQAGKHYNWMKLRNGSFRDYTPDHYQLGYLLVAYGYERYGEDFWRKVTQDAAAFKGLFYPFQAAIKRYSGKEYKAFRQDAMNYFRERLLSTGALFPASGSAAADAASSAAGTSSLSGATSSASGSAAVETPLLPDVMTPSPARIVTDRSFPAFINDSTLVYVKSSYRSVPALVIRTRAGEQRLMVKDISLDNHFSYRNNRIVYAAYEPDLRWGWRNYSVVKTVDMVTGARHTVTRRTRYFTPDINEAGNEIVAVEENTTGKSFLHILDASTGRVLQEMPNPEGWVYTYPKFYKGTGIIAAVRNKTGMMSLAEVNRSNGSATCLLPFAYNVIGFPVIRGDTVYFTASTGTTDALFALSLKDSLLFRLQVPPAMEGSGDYQPAVSSRSVIFSAFTASGFQLRELAKEEGLFMPVAGRQLPPPADLSLSALSASDTNILALSRQSGLAFIPAVTSYPKTTGLFNFHSLEPVFTDPDYQLSLIGENVLNTLQSEVFLNYNTNERFKQLGFNAVYGGWFPYLSLGTSYIFDRNARVQNKMVYWNEAQVNGGLSVPLNLSRGKSVRSLTAGADYTFKHIAYTGAFKDQGTYSFGTWHGFASFSNQVQKAVQHIYPRFAQSVRADYNQSIDHITARQWVASGSLYWPGFWPTHNVVMNLAWHKRDTLDEYFFSNRFPFSRGYESPNLEQMAKWGISYHLPLFCPDAGIAQVLFIQRVRASLFYDHTVGRIKYSGGIRRDELFRSAGAELLLDTKWWNSFPVSFGLRYSYLLDPDLYGGSGNNRIEFILPVNLFQR